MSDNHYSHTPVLLEEALSLLDVKENGVYLDLTLGLAGHSEKILSRLTSGLLIGVDQDEEAIKESQKRLERISDRFALIHSNFVHIDEILKERKIDKVDGVIMDLGVSSIQFDDGKRGFSYRSEARLDMRMNQRQELSAYDVVNEYSRQHLTQILRDYGEEKDSYVIAKKIVKAREEKKIETTFELVDIVKASKRQKDLKKSSHPAKQVFQALRIEVNDELNVLRQTLKKALKVLKVNGRMVVISFHSLEDRIVKQTFKEVTQVVGDRINGPMKEEKVYFRLLTKKPITPSKEEEESNPRSHSGKLRAIEKIMEEEAHERQT